MGPSSFGKKYYFFIAAIVLGWMKALGTSGSERRPRFVAGARQSRHEDVDDCRVRVRCRVSGERGAGAGGGAAGEAEGGREGRAGAGGDGSDAGRRSSI